MIEDNNIAAAIAAFDVYPEIAVMGDWDAFTLAAVEIHNFDISFDTVAVGQDNWLDSFEAEFALASSAMTH